MARASKEQATKARLDLTRLYNRIPQEQKNEAWLEYHAVENFLIDAKKSLPTQEAIDRDRQRKRKKAQGDN